MAEETTLDQQIKDMIERIRPMLQADGGDCELVAIEGNTVKLRLQGACRGCPGARMTLKMGIERRMREEIAPDITVEAVD